MVSKPLGELIWGIHQNCASGNHLLCIACSIPPADGSVPVHISAICTWRVSPYNTEQHILRCNYYTPHIPDHQNDMAVTCCKLYLPTT